MHAALAITRAVADLNQEDAWLNLHIRTAVHTGEALVVLAGAEGEGMATGDVMNTAARIQGGAPVDGVVVSGRTYRATEHVFEFEPAEPVAAKGKAEPVPIWTVIGEKTAKRPVPWRPLVGRTAEIERLVAIWDKACAEGRPHLVTVVGAPGIGKSRPPHRARSESRPRSARLLGPLSPVRRRHHLLAGRGDSEGGGRDPARRRGRQGVAKAR